MLIRLVYMDTGASSTYEAVRYSIGKRAKETKDGQEGASEQYISIGTKNGPEHDVVTSKMVVYVMNDEGKTIDVHHFRD